MMVNQVKSSRSGSSATRRPAKSVEIVTNTMHTTNATGTTLAVKTTFGMIATGTVTTTAPGWKMLIQTSYKALKMATKTDTGMAFLIMSKHQGTKI